MQYPLIYEDDLLPFYRNLIDLPGFLILESQDKMIGRYDIITAYPYDRMSCSEATSNPIDFINAFKARMPSYQLPNNLPFQGGAIGYFSYDFAEMMAGIPCQSLGIQADFGFYDWAIIVDHHEKTVILVAANYHKDTKGVVKEILQRWHHKGSYQFNNVLPNRITSLISREDYEESFYRIKKALHEGRCYQVNYTQPFIADYTGDDWGLYEQIRRSNCVPYAAFLKSGGQTILSFSPERLVRMDNHHLLASPIKGTIKRSQRPFDDQRLLKQLALSEKNRAENVMIVDMLRNDLSKIAQPKTVHVSGLCQAESYASVHHLVSHIEADCIESVLPIDAFMACFPGASITGAPKLESMRVIDEEEPYSRGVYCGSIGYFSAHGRFDTNIAIRTILSSNDTISVSAGGGIVIDSQCDDEYQECWVKIEAIRRAMGH